MTEKQHEGMVNYSLGYLDSAPPDYWYTEQDFNEGYHFCRDWDNLFIGPNDLEFGACTCHPIKSGGMLFPRTEEKPE